MSTTLVFTDTMQKIADFLIKVKYLRPGNVVAYLPVEFEIFKDGEDYKAIPMQNLQASILTNLPNQLVFKVSNGEVYGYKQRHKEVVEDIFNKLVELNIIKKSTCCLACGNKACSKLDKATVTA